MPTHTDADRRTPHSQNKRDSLAFLARAVFRRRRELGLTRLDLSQLGGPSDTTIARIEAPTVKTAFPRPSTLRRLDAGLRWATGSAAGCLILREPIPLNSGDSAPRAHGYLREPDTVELPTELIHQIITTLDAINLNPSGSNTAVKRLQDVADAMRWAYLTREVEDLRTAGSEIPDHLAIGIMSALMCTAGTEPARRDGHADRLYLRWLVGLDDADANGQFAARLDKRRG